MSVSESAIKEIKAQIFEHTDSGMFALAFAAIRRLIDIDRQWWSEQVFDELQTRCVQMLRFNLTGAPDPERSVFISELQYRIYDFVDAIVEDIAFHQLPGYENEQKRVFEHNIKFGTYENTDKKLLVELCRTDNSSQAYSDEQMNAFFMLFKYVWLTNRQLSKDDEDFISGMLSDRSIEKSFRSLVVSALMLRGVRLFDISVFRILVQHIDNENTTVKARVIVSLIMLLSVHGSRLRNDRRSETLFSSLFDNDSFVSDFVRAYRFVVKTFGTDAVTRKITDEIYPEVIKSSSKIRKMLHDNSVDRFDDDLNPEWINAIENSGAADKLREFSDMQIKGEDVYMSTFSGMKGFDFFKETANWFFPFDIRHKSVWSENKENNGLMSFFTEMAPMCNSDKYSFACTLNNMPASALQSIVGNMKGDVEQLKDDMESEKWKTKSRDNMLSTEMRHYVQDLFRFYRLHPRKNDFVNPFDYVVNMAYDETLMRLLPLEAVKDICERIFEVKLWSKSIPMFNFLDNEGVWDAGFYQKMGFCFQQCGMWQEALNGYEKATLLDSDDRWSIKRKALCFKKIGDNKSAMDCYRFLLDNNDKDISVIVSLANCCLEDKIYDKAVSLYYKAYYLNPDAIKIRRGLAWSLFMAGESSKALSVYDSVKESELDFEDFLNIGHIYLALKDFDMARKTYAECRGKAGDDSKFADAILEDAEYFEQYDISVEDIKIVINQIIML